MKTLLYVDCCIRREASRTRKLAEAFLNSLPEGWRVEKVTLMDEPLLPLMEGGFVQRDELLQKGDFSHRRFDYAWQFQKADAILIAAPFYDLSIPALLKVYIENVSVDGITFECDAQGLRGACRAQTSSAPASTAASPPTGWIWTPPRPPPSWPRPASERRRRPGNYKPLFCPFFFSGEKKKGPKKKSQQI